MVALKSFLCYSASDIPRHQLISKPTFNIPKIGKKFFLFHYEKNRGKRADLKRRQVINFDKRDEYSDFNLEATSKFGGHCQKSSS